MQTAVFDKPFNDAELYRIEAAAHDMGDRQTMRLVTEIRRLRAVLAYPTRRMVNWSDEYIL